MSGDRVEVNGGQVHGAIPHPQAAVTAALAQLVATLSLARAHAAERADHAHLAALLQQARAQLDLADEHLLVLDRNRQRSSFRQAERIRHRLEALEVRLLAPNALLQESGERTDSAAA